MKQQHLRRGSRRRGQDLRAACPRVRRARRSRAPPRDRRRRRGAAPRGDQPAFHPVQPSDYRALLDRRDIDVVAVCTPPALHERIVVDALEAGKFVMCEKPLAHTLAAADRILAAARRHPGKLSTVFQFRYLPEVRRTRWLLGPGAPRPAAVRPLQSIRALRDVGASPRNRERPRSRARSARIGGAVGAWRAVASS